PARAVAVIGDLAAAGMPVDGFSLGQPTLDEVFFALTGHAAEPQEDPESTKGKKKKGKAK
ncbi:MAG TPA: daunorubicin/doxorubicin resistance ABC transporter ATP-binding protein DrrA, partial [Fibrobacteria bacterium]|nr:daunorubicin/doxorubicin resistance ABC transporter ATP-binding protein DrrA [Fibrobacteria bacterium]